MLVFAIAFVKPVLIFGTYDLNVMLHATSVCLAIAVVRNIVRPEPVLLQAAGQFKKLADVSIISGGVSVVAAATLLFANGAVASFYGILLDDVVAAILTLSYGSTWPTRFKTQ